MNEARTFTDPAKRKVAYEAALTQIEADRPLIYLYHQALIFAHTAKLEGYRQPPDGIIRIQDLKLAKLTLRAAHSPTQAGIQGRILSTPCAPNCVPAFVGTSGHAFACPHAVCLTAKVSALCHGGNMLRNRMRAGIERGEAQIGTWLTLVRNPSILMLMKSAGLDFARVDMEHTSLSIDTIGEMAAMARALDFPIAVRPPAANREWITRLLDVGVWNLHCPQVESAAHAAEIVAASRYAPRGLRGNGGLSAATEFAHRRHRRRNAASSPTARSSSP